MPSKSLVLGSLVANRNSFSKEKFAKLISSKIEHILFLFVWWTRIDFVRLNILFCTIEYFHFRKEYIRSTFRLENQIFTNQNFDHVRPFVMRMTHLDGLDASILHHVVPYMDWILLTLTLKISREVTFTSLHFYFRISRHGRKKGLLADILVLFWKNEYIFVKREA